MPNCVSSEANSSACVSGIQNCDRGRVLWPKPGRSKQITRWRIADQFRKREPGNAKDASLSDGRATATIERLPDSRGIDLDAVWESEWKENLFEAAIARVKKQIEPKQFQIFDCYVRKEWPAQKVAARLGVNIGQVYLARHRVGALLKKEIKTMEKRGR